MRDWKETIRIFEESGLSIKAYCEQALIKEHALRYHMKKHTALVRSGFVKVKSIPSLPNLEVCYPNGVRILIHGELNPAVLATLIHVQLR
jgi:hypothetical protein